MTFGEMTTETLRRLREAAAAPVFWTVDDVHTALNDGYAELADATEWFETSRAIGLLGLRPYYDGRTVLGDDLLAIGPAFHVDTNRWLFPLSVREADATDVRWERHRTAPQRVLVRSLFWFGYWPVVASDGGVIEQYYTALPPPLVDDGDEPGFPGVFHYACVAFAIADLFAQDGETANALQAWGEYVAIERDLGAYVDERLLTPWRRGYGQSHA